MCDISDSPYQGYIYSYWGDQRNGTSDTDVFFSLSTDGGEAWSPALRVNDDNTTRHQFFPWMTIDQTTGIIWGVFYDRRNTTGSATDVYVVKSTDGGESFENFKVSESSFTPTSSVFFGDYSNIAAWDKKIYPIWSRLQSGQLSVWTTIIEDTMIVPVELTNFSASVNSGNVMLEWETSTETNNLGFEIERARLTDNSEINIMEFRLIGFVQGNGTTTNPNSYYFTDEELLSGVYQYRLKQIDYNGSFNYSGIVELNLIVVNDFRLEQNYPNPFNPSTTINYQLPKAEFITVKIFDTISNDVKTIVKENEPAGVHEVNFDASQLSSGIYLYRIDAGTFHQSKKMLLVK